MTPRWEIYLGWKIKAFRSWRDFGKWQQCAVDIKSCEPGESCWGLVHGSRADMLVSKLPSKMADKLFPARNWELLVVIPNCDLVPQKTVTAPLQKLLPIFWQTEIILLVICIYIYIDIYVYIPKKSSMIYTHPGWFYTRLFSLVIYIHIYIYVYIYVLISVKLHVFDAK